MKDVFANRPLLIASQHRKEEVMAPCLTKALGVICQVAENLNTDLLGTFSGEVARLDDPIRTLRKSVCWPWNSKQALIWSWPAKGHLVRILRCFCAG